MQHFNYVFKINKRFIKQESFFIIFCSVFILFILIDQLTGLNISRELYLILIASYLMVCNEKYFMPTIVFLIPFNIWISLFLVMSIALIIYLIRFREKIRIVPAMFLMVLIIIIDICSAFYGHFSIYQWVRWSLLYISTGFFLFSDPIPSNTTRVIYGFALGYVTVGIITLILIIPIVGIDELLSSYRLGVSGLRNRFNIGNIVIYQENVLGIYSALVVSLMFALIYRFREGNIVCISVALFACAMALMSKSKTGLILILCEIIIFLWVNFKKNKKAFSNLLRLLLLLVLFGGYFYIYHPGIYQSVLGRFIVEDITTGRSEIFQSYNEKFFSETRYLFFGVGQQNYREKLGMTMSAHNTPQQIYVMWGIVGFIIFSIFLYLLYKKYSRINKQNKNILYLCPFMLLLIGSQATHLEVIFPLLIPASIVMCYGQSNRNQTKYSEKQFNQK